MIAPLPPDPAPYWVWAFVFLGGVLLARCACIIADFLCDLLTEDNDHGHPPSP